MELSLLKPVLAALVLPPASPLLLAAIGLLAWGRLRRAGRALALAALAALWLLSCHAVAIGLSRTLLPPVEPATPAWLQAQRVQAIIVLGGGVLPQAPEYGAPQPAAHTLARLRYGLWLARRTGLPVGFAGGVGWAAIGIGAAPEGEVVRRSAQDDFGATLRWVDDQSRDTAENARLMGALLQRDGVQRIALVTDVWHMPRAARAFERVGLAVTPAPTGLAFPGETPLLEWLPSAHGLSLSRQVLREVLARWVAR
ncbi:MAG: YdcF family protein [Ramlibacter sp.]|nr:YdcF family protein [Ramlibacter sp.]